MVGISITAAAFELTVIFDPDRDIDQTVFGLNRDEERLLVPDDLRRLVEQRYRDADRGKPRNGEWFIRRLLWDLNHNPGELAADLNWSTWRLKKARRRVHLLIEGAVPSDWMTA